MFGSASRKPYACALPLSDNVATPVNINKNNKNNENSKIFLAQSC